MEILRKNYRKNSSGEKNFRFFQKQTPRNSKNNSIKEKVCSKSIERGLEISGDCTSVGGDGFSIFYEDLGPKVVELGEEHLWPCLVRQLLPFQHAFGEERAEAAGPSNVMELGEEHLWLVSSGSGILMFALSFAVDS